MQIKQSKQNVISVNVLAERSTEKCERTGGRAGDAESHLEGHTGARLGRGGGGVALRRGLGSRYPSGRSLGYRGCLGLAARSGDHGSDRSIHNQIGEDAEGRLVPH